MTIKLNVINCITILFKDKTVRDTITVSLPTTIKKKLDKYTKKEHINRSEIVREALKQYFIREEFNRLRSIMVPKAEKQGIYTDEDVFKLIS